MSIKIDMTSNDVDRQIALLHYYPEISDKHLRSVLTEDVELLKQEIEPNIPELYGRARQTFKSKVSGFGLGLTGQVGWFGGGKNAPWYINVVEAGAKPHKIEAKEGGFLGFGSTVVKSVDHPGFSARGFMAAGYSAIQPIIDADLQQANENIINELAVK